MNKTDMDIEFALNLMQTALKKGAQQAEVYLKTSNNLNIEVKEQKIDTLISSVSSGYCVRVIKDGRLGFSYSTDPNEADIVAKKAIEASSYSEPDRFLDLPSEIEPSALGCQPQIFDHAIELLSETDAINYALFIEEGALTEDKKIKKIRKAVASFSTTSTYIVNSKGIKTSYKSTGCSAQITVVAEDSGESQMGWDYEGSRFLSEVSFKNVGSRAARRALQLLGAKRITSVKGFVLLDSSVASDFLGLLSSALSAESVQKRKSMLAGKIGELVLNHKLNVIDSGLLDKKLGSKPVDDEGVPTSDKTLIEKGILKGFLHNTYTAKKDNVTSTGNAVRGGFTGIPSVGPLNIYIEAVFNDTLNFEGLVKLIDKGLYVIETMGMHTANPITGEFSIGVSGLWIESGEIKYPVKEAVISGTVLDLFKKVVAVGDDLRFYGNIGAPTLLIEGIDISG